MPEEAFFKSRIQVTNASFREELKGYIHSGERAGMPLFLNG